VVPFVKRPKSAPGISGQLSWNDNWPHGTSHSPHTPITQNIAWVAYQALTTPLGWQPYAETCRGRKIWNVLINIHCFLEQLVAFLQTVQTCTLYIRPSIVSFCLKPALFSNRFASRQTAQRWPLFKHAMSWGQLIVLFTAINPLLPELNPSPQHWLTRFFYWGFCFLNRAFR
jgi:hypothetical protein